MHSKLLTLLTSTLNPSLLEQSQQELSRARTSQGFAPELMIIADDSSNDIKIRQSALIVLKNMIHDESVTGNGMAIDRGDYEIVKGSLLDALARQWGNRQLTPTLREIIHQIAKMDYPDRWTTIVPAILWNITDSGDFNTVSASVQALKAIASVCGCSLEHEVTLNNLCNKTVIPLFELANKLFANYTPETLPILVSIFKIFNLAMFYHLPNIFINNIHSLMVFCKKIVDLQVEEMVPLKLACLKILSRLYARHAGSNISYKLLKFSQEFHQKYSPSLTQSFILQLMTASNSKHPQLISLSLNCLTSIYKNDQKSAALIDKHHQRILEFCLLRFKMGKLRTGGQSVGSFITHLKEERACLVDFVVGLFGGNEGLLAQLIEYLNKGDEPTREIVLYLFSALSQQISDYPQLHPSMCQFIISYILPLLSDPQNSTIMKARGCEIISCYKYIELPASNLQSIFQFIYGCLIENKDSYLRVYALEAFTQLICRYDGFMGIIVPYLGEILKVYTGLMKESNGEVEEVIKSFQLFLRHLNGDHIKDCAIDLVKFLVTLFYEYNQQKDGNNKNKDGKPNSDDEDGEESEDDEDENPSHARSGCLACIREILAIESLPQNLYPVIVSECILQLAVTILSDKQLLHFEQCLNILNLCLYKSQQLPANFEQFFKIFTYAIIGIPTELTSINLQNQYKDILANVCVNPDQDLVENVIGFFRNFIAKGMGQLRGFKDELGVTFMEYLFRIVQHVQQSSTNNAPTYKKSDRSLILTLYTSLLEYQFLQASQFQLIVTNLLTWLSSSTESANQTNVYIEILLVCMYYNMEATIDKVNLSWFIGELMGRLALFKLEYQLDRLVLGVARMLEKQVLKDEHTAAKVVHILPDLIERLIQQRQKQQNESNALISQAQQEQIDAEQEAEEDLIAENTHLGLSTKKISQEKQKQQQLNAYQQAEWDQEYNKFYYSPLLNVNQLEFLTTVLKNSAYVGLLSAQEQERLTQYLCNAPVKNDQN